MTRLGTDGGQPVGGQTAGLGSRPCRMRRASQRRRAVFASDFASVFASVVGALAASGLVRPAWGPLEPGRALAQAAAAGSMTPTAPVRSASGSAPTPAPTPTSTPTSTPPVKVEHWDLARIRGEMKLRRGRPFLIHLWASWCGPCLEELPSVESFARKARSHGIAVVSMSLDSAADSDERVPSALRERAPSLTPVIADFDDPATFGSLFSRTSLPSWEGSIPALFAFDSEGVLRRSILELAEPAELDRLLERLIHDDGAAALKSRARKKPRADAGAPPLGPPLAP